MTLVGLIVLRLTPGEGWREAVRVRRARGGGARGAVWWVFVVSVGPGRRCEAARHVPGRGREEHHHSLLTVLEQCRRMRSLGAARPPARPDGGRRLTGPD